MFLPESVYLSPAICRRPDFMCRLQSRHQHEHLLSDWSSGVDSKIHRHDWQKDKRRSQTTCMSTFKVKWHWDQLNASEFPRRHVQTLQGHRKEKVAVSWPPFPLRLCGSPGDFLKSLPPPESLHSRKAEALYNRMISFQRLCQTTRYPCKSKRGGVNMAFKGPTRVI